MGTVSSIGGPPLAIETLVRDAVRADAVARAETALSRVFALTLSLGGTLSGEHGIGLAKRDFMPRAIDPVTLDLMHAIKLQFDPSSLLNPQKLLPAATTIRDTAYR